MKTKNRLFGRKTNRYFNYRTGAIDTGRSIMFIVFVPVFVFMMIAGAGIGGYIYTHRDKIILSQKTPEDPILAPAPEYQDESPALASYQAKEDPSLVDAINKKLSEMPDGTEWEVSVRDLNTGRMANINADTQMTSASLYKLFLLAPLEERLKVDYWNSWIGGKSVNDCLDLMIRVSDNDCALTFASYIGWDRINQSNKELGFNSTDFSVNDDLKTTSRDVSVLMERLQRSQMLSDKARRKVFDSLYAQEYRAGIPAGCGEGCLVADKVGFLDGYLHDAAIVTHDSAQYVLVIMSKNASWQDIADLSKSIDLLMLP